MRLPEPGQLRLYSLVSLSLLKLESRSKMQLGIEQPRRDWRTIRRYPTVVFQLLEERLESNPKLLLRLV